MSPLAAAWDAGVGALSIKRVRSHLEVGVASLTFDAPPAAVLAACGPLLERRRVRATVHLAAESLDPTRTRDLAALSDAGHELGLLADADVHDAALAKLQDRLAEATDGVRGACLAWNTSRGVGRSAKRDAARRFAAVCGRRPGLNAGLVDLADLRRLTVDAAADVDLARHAAEARARRGWVVLRVRDLSDGGAAVELALDLLAREGLEVLPVKHAAARVLFGD